MKLKLSMKATENMNDIHAVIRLYYHDTRNINSSSEEYQAIERYVMNHLPRYLHSHYDIVDMIDLFIGERMVIIGYVMNHLEKYLKDFNDICNMRELFVRKRDYFPYHQQYCMEIKNYVMNHLATYLHSADDIRKMIELFPEEEHKIQAFADKKNNGSRGIFGFFSAYFIEQPMSDQTIYERSNSTRA